MKSEIIKNFPFMPTSEQEQALEVFSRFIHSKNNLSVMILRGCAGTGKTTLASAIVQTLKQITKNVCLLAPTGRAAKVFSVYSGQSALTIHRKIYKQKSSDSEELAFTLNFNKSKYTLFIVDESSMISNQQYPDAIFGSGCLLDDLIQYVYEEGVNCRIMFMGDRAQLPPVGDIESPALSREVLEGYGLEVFEANLNEVLRQSQDSGILYNATLIREFGDSLENIFNGLPKIRLKGFADVQKVEGEELIEALSNSYYTVGVDETMVVTRSNKRANIHNQGIRYRVLDCEDELTGGDMVMIVKNNYYWVEQDVECELPFIANGDRAVIKRFRNKHELYGFTFADVSLEFPDYDNYEITARALLDTLHSESPALTREQSDMLFNKVLEDYMLQPDCPANRKELIAQVRNDEYYNALQIKFAYAVTCHKAQGGQWAHVYIDQGYITEDTITEDYAHWLYTAFTRATEKLYLINWPEDQISE